MTNEDWRDLYEMLIDTLRKAGASNSIISSVEQVALARVEVNPRNINPNSLEYRSLPAIQQQELKQLETLSNRAPTSREAFQAAFNVIEVYLIELPKVANALQTNLNNIVGEPINITWRSDISEDNFVTGTEFFNIEQITLKEEERETIEQSLRKIRGFLLELGEAYRR